MYTSDIKHENASLKDKLHKLYTLNRNTKIDLGFRPPYLKLLEGLGNPHLKLPPVIHVAGTNGKGSTIAFMRAILEAAGYSVHTYTSPHLIRFNERIVLNGAHITDDFLEELIDEALTANQGRDTTFFEITTAIAFTAFARTPADIILLEVGLGGRLDCTNIIETAAISVINTISYDHMEFLGDTLSEIAMEKAGIMKRGVPCIIGAQQAQIRTTLDHAAESKGATPFRYGPDWRIKNQGVRICFESGAQTHILPKPNLTGPHQIQNAGLAIAALTKLADTSHFRFTDESFAKGIETAFWPARLQKINGPDESHELWLDGGHNEDAGHALAAQAKIWAAQDKRPLHLILGMMAHKDAQTFLKPILPHLKSLTVIDIPNEPASMSAQDLSKKIKDLPLALEINKAANWQSACQNIGDNNTKARILIAGSLYLAGHILQELENNGHNSALK